MIGDKDPEDAYDAGDPIPVRLIVLARVLEAVASRRDARSLARRDAAVLRIRGIADEVMNGG